MLERANFADTEYFGDDKRSWMTFLRDWSSPSMKGANVKLAAGILNDPIAYDMIVKAKNIFKDGLSETEAHIF